MSITEAESASPNNIFNPAEEIRFPAYIDAIFERLTAKDVEQFYSSYQLWLLQRRVGTLQTEITILQQAVANNAEMMQGVAISPITLANLAQLQAYGVNDIELLDRMSERGEGWLDHTMQLLKYCEEIGVIHSNYTQWCEHALDGAYSWIASIAAEAEQETSTDLQATNSAATPIPEADLQAASQTDSSQIQSITEEEVLQKLMSDEGDTEKMPALGHNFSRATQVHTTSTDSTDTLTPDHADETIVAEIELTTPTTDKIEELASAVVEDDLHISGENDVLEEDMLTLHPSEGTVSHELSALEEQLGRGGTPRAPDSNQDPDEQDPAQANGHTRGATPTPLDPDEQDPAQANGRTRGAAPTPLANGPEEIPTAATAEQETTAAEMSTDEGISAEDVLDNKTSTIIEPEMLVEEDLTPTDKFVVLTVDQIDGPIEIDDGHDVPNEDVPNEDDLTPTDKFVVLTVDQIDGPVEIDNEPEVLDEHDLTPPVDAVIPAHQIAEPGEIVELAIEQDELDENDLTSIDKAAVIPANPITEPVEPVEPVEIDTEQIAQEENGTDSAKQEISDATTAEEVSSSRPEQPTTQAVVVLESNPKEKKSSLQKVQRKGFWWFLRKLLLGILRR